MIREFIRTLADYVGRCFEKMINFRELSLDLGSYTDNSREWSNCRIGTYMN